MEKFQRSDRIMRRWSLAVSEAAFNLCGASDEMRHNLTPGWKQPLAFLPPGQHLEEHRQHLNWSHHQANGGCEWSSTQSSADSHTPSPDDCNEQRPDRRRGEEKGGTPGRLKTISSRRRPIAAPKRCGYRAESGSDEEEIAPLHQPLSRVKF